MKIFISKVQHRLFALLNKTFYVLLRSSDWIWSKYKIGDCKTYNHGDLVEMKNPFAFYGSMQNIYDDLLKNIEDKLKNKEPLSIIRCGDGEAYFLQGKFIGNVVRRHFTKGDVNNIDLNLWLDNYRKNDIKSFDINWYLRKLWIPIEGKMIKREYYPLHVVYSLIATRDLLRISKDYKVGLIGAETKLGIIEELMKHKEYQDYLGLKKFDDYILIPETGACNNIDELCKDIIDQCKSNPCDLYILGTGISKLYFQSMIRDVIGCVIIDVGSGIDALAGIIPKDRQNFGKWINYKLTGYDYNGIDILSHHTSQVEKLHSVNEDVII
ncbi:MAG: hypothetical protein OCD02_01290 [Spirochaetaceae bacterium]